MKTYTGNEVQVLLQEFVEMLTTHPVVKHTDGKIWFIGMTKTCLKLFVKQKGL